MKKITCICLLLLILMYSIIDINATETNSCYSGVMTDISTTIKTNGNEVKYYGVMGDISSIIQSADEITVEIETTDDYVSSPPVKSYTDEDLYVLSHVMMGESGGESDKCQLYVGSVVLNRVKSSGFPDTIKDVVFQPKQYVCTWDGNYNKTPTDRVTNNAIYLLENGSVLPDNVIWQYDRKRPNRVYDIVDGEYFCY